MAVLLPTQPTVSSMGCVTLDGPLGLAITVQSSLHIVAEAILRRSEPRLLLHPLTQAQDIAELSVVPLSYIPVFFLLYLLDLCVQRQFFQSHQSQFESGQ